MAPQLSAQEAVVRACVSLLVVLAVVCGLWRMSAEVLHLGKLAGEHSRLDYADRDIAGGNGVIIDQAAVYEARALIPAGSSYEMLIGPHLQNATPLSEPSAGTFFRSFLIPRRQVDKAHWIVCFGCDLARDAPGATSVWSDADGISIARARG